MWHTPFKARSHRPVAWTAGELNPVTCEHENPRLWTVTSNDGDNTSVKVYLLDGADGSIEEELLVTGWEGSGYAVYGGAVDSKDDFWFVGGYAPLLGHVRISDLCYMGFGWKGSSPWKQNVFISSWSRRRKMILALEELSKVYVRRSVLNLEHARRCLEVTVLEGLRLRWLHEGRFIGAKVELMHEALCDDCKLADDLPRMFGKAPPRDVRGDPVEVSRTAGASSHSEPVSDNVGRSNSAGFELATCRAPFRRRRVALTVSIRIWPGSGWSMCSRSDPANEARASTATCANRCPASR